MRTPRRGRARLAAALCVLISAGVVSACRDAAPVAVAGGEGRSAAVAIGRASTCTTDPVARTVNLLVRLRSTDGRASAVEVSGHVRLPGGARHAVSARTVRVPATGTTGTVVSGVLPQGRGVRRCVAVVRPDGGGGSVERRLPASMTSCTCGPKLSARLRERERERPGGEPGSSAGPRGADRR